jgi:hypothetical protein
MTTWKQIKVTVGKKVITQYVSPSLPGIRRGKWGKWQEPTSWEGLPKKAQKEHDWAAPECSCVGECLKEHFSEQSFVKFQGYWIPVENFEIRSFPSIYGIAPDCFFAGTICEVGSGENEGMLRVASVCSND